MQAVTTDDERLARLRLIRSENIGPATFIRLLERFGSAAAAVDALPGIARHVGRRELRIASAEAAAREWRALERLGGRFVMLGEPDYPPQLAALEDAPPLLAVLGNAARLSDPSVAVVGARNASVNGRRLARELAAEIGLGGFVIVSGLARGIDTAAHEAALESGTVAVLAGGIDVVYPPENQALCRRIAESGAVVTEAVLGQQPTARHFPRRNRIISGLSRGVVVVEAALRSGSLITARLAAEQGRDVFAVPGSPLDPRSRGANRLIREGAKLVESAEDVLEELRTQRPGMWLPLATAATPLEREPAAPVEIAAAGGQAELLEALSPEPADADAIIRMTGLAPAAFHALILELEIAGLVQRHAGNRFALSAVDGPS